mmetsp:Transcript_22017/g.70908  ORF Transcript_22017/g.70908 Transcript_22017/m.70908 type:complete len:181 (-) Transcript_22017:350-892(-)
MLRTRSYDLLVSTFQAIALLLFHNSHVSLAFRDVCERMRIDSATGRRVLHSLACGKHRVLLKTGHRKVIDPALDQFKPNKLFTSKLKRFSITMPVLDAERRRDLESDVQHQRNFSIDATLVRIMKARKRLSHQELVGEAIHQIQHFTPDSKLVRQRIEGLIEREYLQRAEGDPKLYIYLP